MLRIAYLSALLGNEESSNTETSAFGHNHFLLSIHYLVEHFIAWLVFFVPISENECTGNTKDAKRKKAKSKSGIITIK
jgi:hypothetical protein